MTYRKFAGAALFGLALAVSPFTGHMAGAETLSVVRSGTSSTLGVPMNRAVVVESGRSDGPDAGIGFHSTISKLWACLSVMVMPRPGVVSSSWR